MADQTKQPGVQLPVISIPGVGKIPVVAIKLPSGQVALRHPSELSTPPAPAEKTGGEK